MDPQDPGLDMTETGTISKGILEVFEQFEAKLEDAIKNDVEYTNFFALPFYDKNRVNQRFCAFCLVKKPDRVHHCRHCGLCVRKLDHHCHILSSCIGIGNYKFFLLTLIYVSILTIFIVLTSFQSLCFYANEYNVHFIF